MQVIKKSILKVIGDIHARQRIRKMHVFKAINQISPFNSVLDAGTGSGGYILHLAKKYQESTFTGIEIKLMKYTFNRYKGALAWELYKLYPYITHPIVMVLGFLDVVTPNKSGGGVLIIAEK